MPPMYLIIAELHFGLSVPGFLANLKESFFFHQVIRSAHVYQVKLKAIMLFLCLIHQHNKKVLWSYLLWPHACIQGECW